MTPHPLARELDPELDLDLARIGAGLPVVAVAPEFQSALQRGAAVVQAPPGSGKTTFLPPLAAVCLGLAAPALVTNPRRILVTQPRRVAARAAAARLAALTGTEVGQLAGFTVRGQRVVGPDTLIEFVTPGIALRRLLKGPELPGVAAVILDEVHERALDTDLLLAMLAEVRQLRDDLKVVAMSATLDTQRFARLLPDDQGAAAAVVDCPAEIHPLEFLWEPHDRPRTDDRGVSRDFLEHIAATTVAAHTQALAEDPEVDALVFVPGAWEVARVAERIRSLLSPDQRTEVLELHGRIDPAAQDRAVRGRAAGEAPRVVVATSLAESSLTVPGVRLVVDSGLAREPRLDTVRGMSGLVTVAASRASAEQRAGRAARLGPGRVVRCYDERTWAAMPAHLTPEIATTDLTDAALLLAVWGAPGGVGLDLPDSPPERSMTRAQDTLRTLGAVDDDGRATPLGRALSEVPTDPRWARALLDGAHLLGARTAAEVVALLSTDTARGDVAAQIRELKAKHFTETKAERAAKTWRAEVKRLERMASATTITRDVASDEDSALVAQDVAPGAVIALARPEWIAHRDGDTYLLAGGTRAGLPAGSPLGGHEWLAVADVARATGKAAGGTGAVIRSGAQLTQEAALFLARPLAWERAATLYDAGRLSARRERGLGAITLSSTPVTPSPDQAAEAVRSGLRREGLSHLPWSPGAFGLRARMAAIHSQLGQPWPAVNDDALLARLDEWLGVEIDALARGGRLKEIDVESALRRLLPWPEAAHLEELAPQRIAVPSGSNIRLIWEGEQPVARVKLQECFGLAESPRVLQGHLPVLFHLLSPAGRELAITADLRSFWEGPYHQVRAEMRGRYPKHPWPEDPWSARATARTTRRMGGPTKKS